MKYFLDLKYAVFLLIEGLLSREVFSLLVNFIVCSKLPTLKATLLSRLHYLNEDY